MMTTYEVTTVEEAINLATRLRDEGKYNWFRGQLRTWPPYSSLARILRTKPERGDAVRHRIEMFRAWLGTVPELRYLGEDRNVDKVYAILQHYGIPTNYIDFTTDPAVAGFFAADGKALAGDTGPSCIYCLDIEDLFRVWEVAEGTLRRSGERIERIEVDVTNLWRLQAQSGVFLYSNYDWAVDYPMDRILFPPSGYPSYPTRERIYPEDKSRLEQLLDEYFSIERTTFFHEWADQHGVCVLHQARPFPEGIDSKAFLEASRVEEHPSWSAKSLVAWKAVPDERFDDVVGSEERLLLDRTADPEETRCAIEYGVHRILKRHPMLRGKAVVWNLDSPPAGLDADLFVELARQIWNGMRRLPYSDVEIAVALASLAALLIAGDTPDRFDTRAFSQVYGSAVTVGFTTADGYGSRGAAGRELLDRAIRGDMRSLLNEEHEMRVKRPEELFAVVYNPRVMFEFAAFKTMFGTQVIPAQVVLRRPAVVFNPALVKIFGNP